MADGSGLAGAGRAVEQVDAVGEAVFDGQGLLGVEFGVCVLHPLKLARVTPPPHLHIVHKKLPQKPTVRPQHLLQTLSIPPEGHFVPLQHNVAHQSLIVILLIDLASD